MSTQDKNKAASWERLEQTQLDAENGQYGFLRTADGIEFHTGDPVRVDGQYQGHIVTFNIVDNYSRVEVKTTKNKTGIDFAVLEHMPGLPSRFQITDVVRLRINPRDDGNYATVIAVHFHGNKTETYDLAIWLGDGTVDDPDKSKRIYSVPKCFLHETGVSE